jgi:UDP-N-acetyl-D-mannosaminuronic acid dehydrogenase
MQFDYDVAIVGGCGRVGLPLGLAFADRGLKVALYDTNLSAVDTVNAGAMPFAEEGAGPVLERLVTRQLIATTERSVVARSENIVVVVGTPVDEHLNPDPAAVSDVVASLADCLNDDHLLILRSTLYPGTTALVERRIGQLGLQLDVTFCPERIAEGKALTELFELPQIVAARSDSAFGRAEKLFRCLSNDIVRLSPEEAELAKLFTNTWRYIKFATANQLFMMANEFGMDYERIRKALAFGYPRASDLPGAGFAAGPCLLKDTMQLAAFNRNNFMLGQAAMSVNEGLPLYIVSKIAQRFPLSELSVGILGMAFKSGSDDTRSSLSYKLKRILRFQAREVLCHDPHVRNDPNLVPLEHVMSKSDLLIIATPHPEYQTIQTTVPVIDIWGATDCGQQP